MSNSFQYYFFFYYMHYNVFFSFKKMLIPTASWPEMTIISSFVRCLIHLFLSQADFRYWFCICFTLNDNQPPTTQAVYNISHSSIGQLEWLLMPNTNISRKSYFKINRVFLVKNLQKYCRCHNLLNFAWSHKSGSSVHKIPPFRKQTDNSVLRGSC